MAERWAHAAAIVDENLFYKGVDKSIVHGARLHQSHSSEHTPGAPPEAPDPIQPPYPFVVRHPRPFRVRGNGR